MVFYRFSQVAGRIAPSTSSLAYTPQGLQKPVVDIAKFAFSSSSTKKVAMAPALSMHHTETEYASASDTDSAKGVIPSSEGYRKFVKLQQQFLADDGLMVWQKRGLRDKIPLWITYATIVAGMVAFVKTMYEMVVPKKPKS